MFDEYILSDINIMLRLLKISNRAFSLDHSGLKADVTTSGVRNFKLPEKPIIEGYLNGSTLPKGSPTVIMIHQWWGFNKSITQTADIFASKDIRVCVPDLYRGEAANSAEEAGHKMTNLKWPQALEDLAALKAHFEKEGSSVSVVGFCMGGALTLAALSSISGWKAGGIFYGIPDLNIFRLDKIKAKVAAHFGQQDPLKGFSDVESARKLKADCQRAGYPMNVHIYQKANHAFCNQDSKYFDQNARNLAFQRTRSLILS